MIYDLINADDSIRQGDIFFPLPYTILSLAQMQTLKMAEDAKFSTEKSSWENLKENGEDIIAIATGLRKTWGIVATQDCDSPKSPLISLFQIEPFEDVFKMGDPKSNKSWQSAITTQCRLKSNMFYLPPVRQLELVAEWQLISIKLTSRRLVIRNSEFFNFAN